jgi:hypothetical protein
MRAIHTILNPSLLLPRHHISHHNPEGTKWNPRPHGTVDFALDTVTVAV